jgi:hypothetical protein
MSIVRPHHLKVLPDDIGRVGLDGAVLLALIRYVTALTNAYSGRTMIDGEVWWLSSQTDIGTSLGGVDRYTIMRLLSKLESVGELRVCVPDVDNRRLKAYRLPELQLRDSAHTVSSNCANPRDIDAIPHNGRRDSAQFSTSLKNLNEMNEPARGSRDDAPLPVVPRKEHEYVNGANRKQHDKYAIFGGKQAAGERAMRILDEHFARKRQQEQDEARRWSAASPDEGQAS